MVCLRLTFDQLGEGFGRRDASAFSAILIILVDVFEKKKESVGKRLVSNFARKWWLLLSLHDLPMKQCN